jgi:tRNA threonylcarbamoyladenosine biosynthesis protein TsaB
VRILAIDTSSQRGSVALVDDGRAVAVRAYEGNSGHDAQAIRLIDAVFAEAGWERGSLDRVATGVGPGTFTGLRVGISVAQGIALALGKPAMGVGSLRAMCRGVPDSMPGLRCAFGDARRGDLFAAAYDARSPELGEVAGPLVIPRAEIADWVSAMKARSGESAVVMVGAVLAQLAREASAAWLPSVYRSELTDEPHAVSVALVAAELAPASAPAEPEYVREADAIRPNLPRHPVWSGEVK